MARRIIIGAIILALCAAFGARLVYLEMQPDPAAPSEEAPAPQATTTPMATTTTSGSQGQPPPKAPASSGLTVMAWLYPGSAACSAKQEYQDGRVIDVLKPEYFTVGEDGRVVLLTEAARGCNGYSAKNAADVRAHSSEQFVTVSGLVDGIRALATSEERRAEATQTLVSFVVDANFTGVEIDFEDYGNWDESLYQGYLSFLTELGDALHARGKKLMVDVPPISNATEAGYYVLTYEDVAATPADYIVIMAYDYQFDHGAGSALAPDAWVRAIIARAKAAISDRSRIVIGIPSYGYSGATGAFAVRRHSYADLAKVPGFDAATRDPSSHERMFEAGGKSYVYVDAEALDAKLALIRAEGITAISVWSLGGNQWFSR